LSHGEFIAAISCALKPDVWLLYSLFWKANRRWYEVQFC